MPSWIGFTVPSANTSHSATVKSVSAALVAACSVAVTGPVSSRPPRAARTRSEAMSSRPSRRRRSPSATHSAQQLRPTVSSTRVGRVVPERVGRLVGGRRRRTSARHRRAGRPAVGTIAGGGHAASCRQSLRPMREHLDIALASEAVVLVAQVAVEERLVGVPAMPRRYAAAARRRRGRCARRSPRGPTGRPAGARSRAAGGAGARPRSRSAAARCSCRTSRPTTAPGR